MDWQSFFNQTGMVKLKCSNCGTEFAMDEQIYRLRQQDGESFYCPNGHGLHFAESENSQLKKKVEELNQHIRYLVSRNNELDKQIKRWKQKAAGYKGQWTKLKNKLEAMDGTKKNSQGDAPIRDPQPPQD